MGQNRKNSDWLYLLVIATIFYFAPENFLHPYIKDNLSAFDKSIEEIVNGYFFKQLVKSFKCNSIKNGKPKCCSRTCGKNLDAHKNGHTTSIKYKEEKWKDIL